MQLYCYNSFGNPLITSVLFLQDLTELKIFPENGTLQPLESCKVSISYNAQNLLSFTKYISVQIMGGEKR